MSSVGALSKLLTEFYDKMASWESSVIRDSAYSLAQIHTLEVLGNYGPMRMKELARYLGITTGTLTVQVDKLVKLALVKRQYSENDRRAILVELTDEGLEIFKHHDSLHLALTEELTKSMNDDELNVLESLLKKLNHEF